MTNPIAAAYLIMLKGASRAVIGCVERFLAQLQISSGYRVLLGLSGGADSVALLYALAASRPKFQFELTAAHLNHALRGVESDRDEAFVSELCGRLGVDLMVEHVRGLDRSQGNLEARARAARHRFLGAVAKRVRADYIALAHQADDQAETVLMRLLRGAGVTGLGAMTASGSGQIIRPLLEVRRGAILKYLKEIGATFVEDSTNASLEHDRNRVRHRLMPLLEREFAPGLAGRLVELAAEMRDVDDLLGALAQRALAGCSNDDGTLDLDRFKLLHPAIASAALRRYLAAQIGNLQGLQRAHFETLRRLCLNGPPNGRIQLPDGWLVRRVYGKLLVRKTEEQDEAVSFEVPLALEGVTVVETARTAFESSLIPRARARMPHGLSEAVFDAREVRTGLSVRNFTPGDRIAPLGLGGTRKVKEVFIDSKIPMEQRRRFPVVLLDGQVAWLPGLVRSNLALVTATTTEVVQLSAKSEHCLEFVPRASVY
ncbi:MAG: tRNA lysidine(34) synthetase TilS [Candidatus Binataceae bacterium]